MSVVSDRAASEIFEFLCAFRSINAIKALYDSISNDLPEGIEESPLKECYSVPEGIDRENCSYFNYDEAHSGRFSLFNTEGATIESSHVLDRPNALEFIRDKLSFGTLSDQQECVVFFNGMRTFSQPSEQSGMPSSKRVEFYSDTLLGLRMAHVHTATNLDQPPGKVNVKNTTVLKTITRILSIAGINSAKPNEDGILEVSPTIIDIIQAAASVFGLMGSPIKQTLRKLINLAAEDNTPLTLMVYSRGSSECNAAFRECVNDERDNESFMKRISKSLTIMTIGASAKVWPSGPKYIHLSSWDDAIARFFCNANRNTFAGRNAVFLHNNSPYPGTMDSHNFQGGTLQFLAVVMLRNNVRSIEDLWRRGQENRKKEYRAISREGIISNIEATIGFMKRMIGIPPSPVGGGSIIIPHNVDVLVLAMIAITGGTDYLWDIDAAMKVMKPLPEKDDAIALLVENLGCDEEINSIAEKFENRRHE